LPAFKAANRQQANHCHRDQHVSRGIGEVDRLTADVADREEVVDIELMDRIEGHVRGSLSTGPANLRDLSKFSGSVRVDRLTCYVNRTAPKPTRFFGRKVQRLTMYPGSRPAPCPTESQSKRVEYHALTTSKDQAGSALAYQRESPLRDQRNMPSILGEHL